MTAESTTSFREHRLKLRPQFSLRWLLLAVTAFAIGFPIWYRWPYQEVEQTFASPGGPVVAKRIITWQRQWGGGQLKHGIETWIFKGETVKTIMYRRGQKHGPVMARDASGQLVVVGQHVDDKKQGVWTDSSGSEIRIANWHHDKLEGPYLIQAQDGRELSRLLFAAGHLTHFNGQPARNRLFDLQEAGTLESRIADELPKSTAIEFVEHPLDACAEYLQELHGLTILVDLNRVPQADLPLTADLKGIDFCSALTLLTAPHDLGCDYRYGCIWITTAKDTEDWHDPTGVSSIAPAKNSSLARAWNDSDPFPINLTKQPLAPLVTRFAEKYGIQIDTTQIEPAPANPNPFLITVSTKDLHFRHLLGILLYNTGCRCRLEGDTLIILPPESP